MVSCVECPLSVLSLVSVLQSRPQFRLWSQGARRSTHSFPRQLTDSPPHRTFADSRASALPWFGLHHGNSAWHNPPVSVVLFPETYNSTWCLPFHHCCSCSNHHVSSSQTHSAVPYQRQLLLRNNFHNYQSGQTRHRFSALTTTRTSSVCLLQTFHLALAHHQLVLYHRLPSEITASLHCHINQHRYIVFRLLNMLRQSGSHGLESQSQHLFGSMRLY